MESNPHTKLHRLKNMKHKRYSKSQYFLLKQLQNSTQQPKHKFNFKKTTAKKYKYSCGGYGGCCRRCKGHKQYGKGKVTVSIFHRSGQTKFTLSSKIALS